MNLVIVMSMYSMCFTSYWVCNACNVYDEWFWIRFCRRWWRVSRLENERGAISYRPLYPQRGIGFTVLERTGLTLFSSIKCFLVLFSFAFLCCDYLLNGHFWVIVFHLNGLSFCSCHLDFRLWQNSLGFPWLLSWPFFSLNYDLILTHF